MSHHDKKWQPMPLKSHQGILIAFLVGKLIITSFMSLIQTAQPLAEQAASTFANDTLMLKLWACCNYLLI